MFRHTRMKIVNYDYKWDSIGWSSGTERKVDMESPFVVSYFRRRVKQERVRVSERWYDTIRITIVKLPVKLYRKF